MVYAGVCPECEQVVAVIMSPDPVPEFLDGSTPEEKQRYRRDVAKEVASYIESGLLVRCMDDDEAKAAITTCLCSCTM